MRALEATCASRIQNAAAWFEQSSRMRGRSLSRPSAEPASTTARAWLSLLGAPIESLEVDITVPSRFFGAFEQALHRAHTTGIESVQVTD